MKKYSDALKKSMEKRKLLKDKEKLNREDPQMQQYPKAAGATENNISMDIIGNQTSYDSHDSFLKFQEKQDNKTHHINSVIEKNSKKLKDIYVEKDEISKKLMMLRMENSKYLFKKARSKKPIFSKKRKEKLFTLFKPNSIISESFKYIRTILLNMIKDKNVKTILVTSALPEEGKSFIASNLAVSIARGLDQHVLLVNADLKKPSLDEIFNITSELGLSDYLVNEKLKLSDLIQKTELSKLSYLPAGSTFEQASELLASQAMKLFVLEMKYRYDDRYVIFDSPPAQMSETLGLTNKVDGIILVVKAGKTDKKLIRETTKIIGIERIIGAVLNYFELKALPYYKYYK